jgi:Dolichyl-phosphate-mannose-protein mannosyltransferase
MLAGSAGENRRKLWIFGLIILLATGLRIANYLANHSLVHDEAADAVNLIHRSYGELRKPLDFWVVAPIGFLYAEKFVGQLFGYSEYSLRLIPLLAGIALVPAFLWIVDDLFDFTAAWIGGLLLATCWRLIEWSARVKPYAIEPLLALVTIYIICRGIRRGWPVRYLLLAALWGAVTQWFSFPMILVLAGVGGVAVIDAMIRGNWRITLVLVAIGVLWVGIFAMDLTLAMNIGSTKGHVDRLWDAYFMPHSWRAIVWIPWVITMIFRETVRLGPWEGLPVIVLVGSFLIVQRRRGWPVLLAIAPIVPAMLAAAVNKYPFGDRLALYIVPLLVLIIAAGIAELLRWRSLLARLLGAGLFLVMFLPDLGIAAARAIHPPALDDNRLVYAYIVAHHQSDDGVYVSFFAIPSYDYYAPRLELDRLPAELGRGMDPGELKSDLDQLSGRVWIVSDLLNVDTTDKAFRQLLQMANERGQELDHFQISHVEAHLYDLRANH